MAGQIKRICDICGKIGDMPKAEWDICTVCMKKPLETFNEFESIGAAKCLDRLKKEKGMLRVVK